jgi:hypothetical protein
MIRGDWSVTRNAKERAKRAVTTYRLSKEETAARPGADMMKARDARLRRWHECACADPNIALLGDPTPERSMLFAGRKHPGAPGKV